MQSNRTIPEFLCFKYKGVRRVDQILANFVPFAWKCRKYQNWKDVQNAADDKPCLLNFAEELLDGGKIVLSDYGRISGIFYNVQRWRKDKQELAAEPDILTSWTEVDCLLSVVAENPKIVVQKLEKEVSGARQIPLSLVWDFFYMWTLLEMLKAQKVPGLPDAEMSPITDKEKLERNITKIVGFLYGSVGLSTPALRRNSGVRGLIATTYRDLGFPTLGFDHIFSKEDFGNTHSPKTVVVRYAELGPLQLLKTDEVEGNIRLAINSDHAFVQEAVKDDKAKTTLEYFLSAYAEASQQFPAQKESLEALTSYLGIILRRKTSAKH